jgi:hypothetical protein
MRHDSGVADTGDEAERLIALLEEEQDEESYNAAKRFLEQRLATTEPDADLASAIGLRA